MHPFTHSQTHRLLTSSQSQSTPVQSHPRHPSQLPGGLAEHTLQSFPTGRCPLLPLGGLNEPTQHPLPTASLPLRQWPQREAEAGGIVCNLTVWTLDLIQAFASRHPVSPQGLTCRPRLLPQPGSHQTPAQVLQLMEARWVSSLQSSSQGTVRPRSDEPDTQPTWMLPVQAPRLHWSQRQHQRSEQLQQHQPQQPQPATQLSAQQSATDDTLDILQVCGTHPQQSQWRQLWQLSHAAYFHRPHRVLWWRILHGSLMCGAYKAYIHRAAPAQATCPFSCCSQHSQPQTLTHLFLACPVAGSVTSWLCRLWQAITGHMPAVTAASMLAADTSPGQCSSDTQLQAWHRLRLAVLHSIWAASQIAQTQRDRQALPDSAPSRAHTPSSSSPASSSSSSSSSSVSSSSVSVSGRIWTVGTVRRQFRAAKSAWQHCVTLKEA